MTDKKIQHVGRSAHRLDPAQGNPREVAFAEQWAHENGRGRGIASANRRQAMKLPGKGDETILARDRYRNKILLHGNTDDGGSADGGFDLRTDGRVLLSRRLAVVIQRKLGEFVEALDRAEQKR